MNKKFKRFSGIILGTKDVGESDKLVVIFSPELGKYNIMAYGANRFKSRFSNKINMSNIVRGFIRLPSGIDRIPSLEDISVVMNFFDHFRHDPFKLFGVNLILESIYASVPMEVFDEELYNLVIKIFSKLVETENGNEVFLVVSTFLIVFLRLQGILPFIKEEKDISNKTKSFIISLLKDNTLEYVPDETKLEFLRWFERNIQKISGNKRLISIDLISSLF